MGAIEGKATNDDLVHPPCGLCTLFFSNVKSKEVQYTHNTKHT